MLALTFWLAGQVSAPMGADDRKLWEWVRDCMERSSRSLRGGCPEDALEWQEAAVALLDRLSSGRQDDEALMQYLRVCIKEYLGPVLKETEPCPRRSQKR